MEGDIAPTTGKAQVQAKFEVAVFSGCRNIMGNQGHTHVFLDVIISWALANLSCIPYLKSLISAVADI